MREQTEEPSVADDDDADRLIETLEAALEAERAARVAAEADFAERLAKAQYQVGAWREAAEVEHGNRLEAEAERDALMGMLVVEANRPFEGKWLITAAGSIGLCADLRLIHDTREQAIAAVRKAAGLDAQV